MANNRMYLRCRGCGAELMLGKTMGHGWYTPVGGVESDEFFDKHEHCCCGLSEETCDVPHTILFILSLLNLPMRGVKIGGKSSLYKR